MEPVAERPEQALDMSGHPMDEVLAAYLDVGRESGAQDLRGLVLGAAPPVARAHDRLVEIEDAIKASVRSILEGRGSGARVGGGAGESFGTDRWGAAVSLS